MVSKNKKHNKSFESDGAISRAAPQLKRYALKKMEQSYEKLIIEFDWSKEIFGLMVTTFCNNELIVFCDCGSNQKKHLKLHFGVVEAFLVHEEFCHPDMDRLNSECPPSLSNGKFYPLLKVKQSQWKESFTEYRSLGGKSIYEHYQVLSTSNILDVLSNSPPIISWVSQKEIISIENFLDANA